MEYRLIPNTEIEVSTLCLGTMTFGDPVKEKEAIHIVDWAIDHGINFIDTADMYEGYTRTMGSPGGVTEEILGMALKGKRDQVIVTTKVGNAIGDDSYRGAGLSRSHIMHQIDASLKRMQTDYTDFYHLHRPDPDTPLGESIAVMAELIQAGKVRHWGFSNFEVEQIREMLQLCEVNSWPRPVISQPNYSWLNREVEEEHLPLCRKEAIAVTPFKVLEGGLLTGKYRKGQEAPGDSRNSENPGWIAFEMDDDLFTQLDEFENKAKEKSRSPVRHAVTWVLEQGGVASVVLGLKRPDQLEDLL
jgi:L-glyceraldehyde 3-phosphate reductase